MEPNTLSILKFPPGLEKLSKIKTQTVIFFSLSGEMIDCHSWGCWYQVVWSINYYNSIWIYTQLKENCFAVDCLVNSVVKLSEKKLKNRCFCFCFYRMLIAGCGHLPLRHCHYQQVKSSCGKMLRNVAFCCVALFNNLLVELLTRWKKIILVAVAVGKVQTNIF